MPETNQPQSRYTGLSRNDLIRLLERRDRGRKFGLVWERNEIEADLAVEDRFVAATPVSELHEDSGPWNNLVIEGDNYDALRWLRMTLAGRIRCIYVDPPYNTGNKDWVYNDRLFDAQDKWRHSTWLEFLYRRFVIARDLLAEDGVLLVSINEENRAKLELMLDEVLPGMRIGSFVWRTKHTANDNGRNFSSVHEYVLAYGKPGFRFQGEPLTPEKYNHDDRDGRGPYSADPLTKAHTRQERADAAYPIRDPKTGWWYPCSPDRVWAYASRDRIKPGRRIKTQPIEDLIDDGRIHFPARKSVTYHSRAELGDAIQRGVDPRDGKGRPLIRMESREADFWLGKPIGLGRPFLKSYWREKADRTRPVSSLVVSQAESAGADLTSDKQGSATAEIEALFGSKAFNFPKPSSLLVSLLRACTRPGDLVLDFFAGSATTAQAVMTLNAQDEGQRRFIMVSSTERTAQANDKNLCRDITAGRVRKLNASTQPAHAHLHADFAYLRCRGVAFEDLDYDIKPPEVWAALETLHRLPLTPHTGEGWMIHETEALRLVYVDRYDERLGEWLQAPRDPAKPIVLYTWAPGQLRDRLSHMNIEVHGVRETLVARFRQ